MTSGSIRVSFAWRYRLSERCLGKTQFRFTERPLNTCQWARCGPAEPLISCNPFPLEIPFMCPFLFQCKASSQDSSHLDRYLFSELVVCCL